MNWYRLGNLWITVFLAVVLWIAGAVFFFSLAYLGMQFILVGLLQMTEQHAIAPSGFTGLGFVAAYAVASVYAYTTEKKR